MTSAQLIKILRMRAKETQGDLAKAINVSRSYVSEFENERCSPSLKLMKDIAKHYGVPAFLVAAPDLIGHPQDDDPLKPVYDAIMMALGRLLTGG